MKRGFLVTGIGLCAVVVGISPEAWANGAWRAIRTEANGSTAASGDSARSNNNINPRGGVTQPWKGSPFSWWSDDLDSPDDYGASGSAQARGGGASVSSSGQVRTIFRWETTTGDPVPKWLTIRVRAQVNGAANAINGRYHADTAWMETYNDRGKEHASASANGVSGVQYSQTPTSPTSVDTGPVWRLAQVATNGQTEVAGPWVPFSASISVDGGRVVTYPDTDGGDPIEAKFLGNAYASLDYQSWYDPRSLQISSSIEDSFMRANGSLQTTPTGWQLRPNTPVPPQPGPYALQWKRNGGGSMIADSVARWDQAMGMWRADAVFNAQTPGFTSPTYRWSLSGDGQLTSQTAAQNQLASWNLTGPQGALLLGSQPNVNQTGPTGDSPLLGKSSTIRVDVAEGTAPDIVKADNTFTVNWHLPAENAVPAGSGPDDIELWDPVEGSAPDGVYANEYGNIPCEIRVANIGWYAQDYIRGFGSGWSAVSNMAKNPGLLILMQAIGQRISQTDLGLERYLSVPNSPNTWAESMLLTNLGKKACVPAGVAWDECKMISPFMSMHYAINKYDCERYDLHGYNGQFISETRTPKASYPQYAGVYVRKQPLAPNPTPTSPPGG